MAWFKTDDKLPAHRKARAVRKSSRKKRRCSAPFGIWVQAGAWSDDGFVPLEILEDWDDDAEEYAERLVVAGLWHATERDGEPGYVFHDWHDQNPFKDDNDPSSTGTFGNHVRWHVQRQLVMPDCGHCPNEPGEESADDRPDIGATSPPDIGVIGSESLPSRPDPTRTRPEPENPSRASALGESDPRPIVGAANNGTPDRFDEFWETYGKKTGRKKAEQKYRLALKKPGVTEDLLIASAAAYVTRQMADCKHPQFTKDPATWLNGEHWNDQHITPTAPVSRVGQHMALVRELTEAEGEYPPQIGGAS